MMKKNILLLTVLTIIFSLSNANLMAQEKDSPFLITGKLPHLTKLLIEQWDSPALHLSEEQKTKLLVVRKMTITGVQKLSQEITSLEKQVTEEIFAGKTPDELHSIVQNIAELKGEATMIHLQCIYDTSKILNQQQLIALKKL